MLIRSTLARLPKLTNVGFRTLDGRFIEKVSLDNIVVCSLSMYKQMYLMLFSDEDGKK